MPADDRKSWSATVIPRLKGEANYAKWKTAVKLNFRFYRLTAFLKGKAVSSTQGEAEADDAYAERSEKYDFDRFKAFLAIRSKISDV